MGTPSTTNPKARFFAKNGNFVEKEFLSKEVSGRKVELDEVIVLSLQLESSTSVKSIHVMPTPTREEANDDDYETSDQVTTKIRRSTKVGSAPEWYGSLVLKIMLLDNSEPMNYGLARNLSYHFLKFGDVTLLSKSFSLISSNPNRRSVSS